MAAEPVPASESADQAPIEQPHLPAPSDLDEQFSTLTDAISSAHSQLEDFQAALRERLVELNQREAEAATLLNQRNEIEQHGEELKEHARELEETEGVLREHEQQLHDERSGLEQRAELLRNRQDELEKQAEALAVREAAVRKFQAAFADIANAFSAPVPEVGRTTIDDGPQINAGSETAAENDANVQLNSDPDESEIAAAIDAAYEQAKASALANELPPDDAARDEPDVNEAEPGHSAEAAEVAVAEVAADSPAAGGEPPEDAGTGPEPIDEAELRPDELEKLRVLRRLTGGKVPDTQLLARIRGDQESEEAHSAKSGGKHSRRWWGSGGD
ncbi:MAG: hypothetical protein KKB50_08290 [Planctomycetes bacterium]|nr:hypothetical protein [Planctomycetota bacterium]